MRRLPLATWLGVALCAAAPATAEPRPTAIASAGGLVGLGGSRYTTFFPDPSAAWTLAVRGDGASWRPGTRVRIAPELAAARGLRLLEQHGWTVLAGPRVTVEVERRQALYLAARAGWRATTGAMGDVAAGLDVTPGGGRVHLELELGALLARPELRVGDTGPPMTVRATYVSVHLGAAVGIGF